MSIPFEEWVNAIGVNEEAALLFREAIHCYKFSAFRPAFLLSFIGLQSVLKARILEAKNPFPPSIAGAWQPIKDSLMDDEKWDAEVGKCVRMTGDKKVFTITAATATAYDNYKNIRNVCAHGKKGNIDYRHVECFWEYIQENYYKFVIIGGKDGIIQDIHNHYDKTLTAPGTDSSYIVERIKIGVSDEDIGALLKDFYDFCDGNSGYGFSFTDSNRMIDLWDKLVNESDDRIQRAIIHFIIHEHREKVCDFVGRYPSTADMFLHDNAFARVLWTGLLVECISDENGFWILLDKIIRRNLIPGPEKLDFDESLLSHIGYIFPKEHKELLQNTTYFELLKNKLFDIEVYREKPSGITRANKDAEAIAQYIEEFGMDTQVVECIDHLLEFTSYGTFYNRIKKLADNIELMDEYQKLSEDCPLVDLTNA